VILQIMSKIKETAIKIDRLQRLIGSIQLHLAVKRIRKSSHFIKYDIVGTQIKKFLFELGIDVSTSIYDRKFSLTTWDNWKEVIANDVTKEIKYVREYFDCDNFAFTFSTLASMLYGLTSATPTYGDTNLGRHYFNIIITRDDGELNAHLYEPISGKYSKIKKDKILQIGSMTYEPMHIHLF